MSWLCRHCIIAYAYACAFAQDENALLGEGYYEGMIKTVNVSEKIGTCQFCLRVVSV